MTRRRWLRAGVTAVTAVAVGGGGYATYAAATQGPSGYRTALVTTGDVDETLALSGTVSPVGRSDLAFGATGTVASVVAEGSHVRKGQVVARLDRTSLRRDVTRAQAAVDAAKLHLHEDENAQASQVSNAAASSSASATPQSHQSQSSQQSHQPQQTGQTSTAQPSSQPTATPTGPSPQVQQLLEQLGAEQHAVETAQSAVSQAVAAARAAMDAQSTACTTSSPTSEPTESPSASSSASPSDDPTADLTNACQAALAAVQSAQQQVADAEYDGNGNLKDALDALARTLSTHAGQVSSTGSDTQHSSAQHSSTQHPSTQHPSAQPTQHPTSQPTSKPSSQPTSAPTTQPTAPTSSPSAADTAPNQAGQTVTAATLAQDQAKIDQAKADLVTAQQALHGATLRAPAAGTVAAVDVAKGDSASAGTDAVTIVSKGLTSVEVSVSDSQVRHLKVGQRATVTPAGSDTSLAGTVSRIGELPDTSSGSTTYPVTITLSKRGLGLLTGTTAAVDVVVGAADDVLTVPTSAVSNGTVTLLVHGRTQRVRVTTGLVGRTRIQITDGLSAGQRVVLADLSIPLPSGNDTSTSRGSFGRAPEFGLGGGPVTFTR